MGRNCITEEKKIHLVVSVHRTNSDMTWSVSMGKSRTEKALSWVWKKSTEEKSKGWHPTITWHLLLGYMNWASQFYLNGLDWL